MFRLEPHYSERSAGQTAGVTACEAAFGPAVPELVHLPFAVEWLAEAGTCEAGTWAADNAESGHEP